MRLWHTKCGIARAQGPPGLATVILSTYNSPGEPMPTAPLPTKLKNEPLVDAVFEIRFSSAALASSVLPGIFFAHIQGQPQIDRFPVAEIPSEIRAGQPNFRFQPLMRIHWGESFFVLIGDYSVGLGCRMPYAGWRKFKPHILELVGLLVKSGVLHSVERYSLKYVGVIEGTDVAQQIKRIDIGLRLGKYTVQAEPFQLRVEMRHDSLIHIVQLGAPSTAMLMDGSQRIGILIDIDTIFERTVTDVNNIMSELPSKIEDIHTRNKEIFFELLTKETLEYLEPSYDPIPNEL